jgi:hypothetical protein
MAEDSKALAKQSEPKAPLAVVNGVINIDSFESAWRMSQVMLKAGFAPSSLKTPEAVTAAMLAGTEIGLTPFQSVQSIAMINGRPSLWGDGLKALVLASPVCEYVKEEFQGEGENLTAVCRSKRKGVEYEHVTRFSWSDAKRAGLAGKDTYKSYGPRMIQMRARAFNLRDNFADVIRGVRVMEEEQDFEFTRKGVASTSSPSLQSLLPGRDAGAETPETPADQTEQDHGDDPDPETPIVDGKVTLDRPLTPEDIRL